MEEKKEEKEEEEEKEEILYQGLFQSEGPG